MVSHHGLLQTIGGGGSAAFIVCTLQTSLGIDVSGGWVLPVGFFLSPSNPPLLRAAQKMRVSPLH